MSRQMPKKEVKALAFDVACGFFKEDQLLIRYDLSLNQLKHIRKQRAFQREVDETTRLLKDDGSEFLVRAKEYAMDSLESLNEIATDTTVGEANRIKASGMIFSMAKLMHLPGKGGDGTIGTLLINTNLALNHLPQGSYEASALPLNQAKTIEGEFEQVPSYQESANSDLL